MKNHGFKNEKELIGALNGKNFTELSKNLQKLIKNSFKNHHEIIKAKSEAGNNKSDLKITIGAESHTYSVKMGKGNSVHQEPLKGFILFLEQHYQLPSSTKEALQRFIWADGSVDGRGKITQRVSSKKFKKRHPRLIKEVQQFFDQHKEALLRRFLIKGKESHSMAEFIYYGTVKKGVVCKSEEVVQWVAQHHSRGVLTIGKLSFQAWNRNLKGKKRAEHKRGVIQLKWGGLKKDIRKIAKLTAGKQAEVNFTKRLNAKNQLALWHTLQLNPKNHYAIQIKYQQYGVINQQKVWAKADVFMAHGAVPQAYLEHNNYFLDEDDVTKFKLHPISFSGISIKQKNSKHYTIAKLSTTTFKKLFHSTILAAGASIYYRKKENLPLNPTILKGWGISEEEFFNYYTSRLSLKITSLTNPNCQRCLKTIKRYAKKEIAHQIKEDITLSNFIFLGIGNFNEPFTAPWLYEQGELRKNSISPFCVTTGSGRSKGRFTLIIKPK